MPTIRTVGIISKPNSAAAARIAAQGQPQQELSNQAGAIKQALAQATPETRQAVGNLHPGPALHESAQLAGQAGKHLHVTRRRQYQNVRG